MVVGPGTIDIIRRRADRGEWTNALNLGVKPSGVLSTTASSAILQGCPGLFVHNPVCSQSLPHPNIPPDMTSMVHVIFISFYFVIRTRRPVAYGTTERDEIVPSRFMPCATISPRPVQLRPTGQRSRSIPSRQHYRHGDGIPSRPVNIITTGSASRSVPVPHSVPCFFHHCVRIPT